MRDAKGERRIADTFRSLGCLWDGEVDSGVEEVVSGMQASRQKRFSCFGGGPSNRGLY